MRETEILVHVSAPSGARDDARYRAQVEAILGFETVSRRNVFGPEDAIDVESTAGEAVSTVSTRTAADAEAGRMNSGDELRSVISTGSSPRADIDQSSPEVSAQTDQDEVSHNATGLTPEPPDKERDALSRESHPRVSQPHETPTQSDPYTRPRSALSDSALGPKDTAPSVPTHRRSQSDSLATPLSVIPDSQPERQPISKNDLEEEKAPSENVQVARSFYAETAPPSSKRRRLDPPSSRKGDAEADESIPSSVPDPEEEQSAGQKQSYARKERSSGPLTSTRAFKPAGSIASSSTRQSEVEQSRLISLSSLPLEIHPPPPPVSTEKFKSHITPTLHMLAERLKLSRTYRPTRQTRELHPLERGFWLLLINVFMSETGGDEDGEEGGGEGKPKSVRDRRSEKRATSVSKSQQKSEVGARNNWTLSFFTRFWSFLSDFIAKEGRAGWGVWCILEEAQSSGTDTAPSTSQRYENGNNTKSLTLKVYAWGEVAAHVYLLLFLASERRIRGMRAQWKDGVEETVIEMP